MAQLGIITPHRRTKTLSKNEQEYATISNNANNLIRYNRDTTNQNGNIVEYHIRRCVANDVVDVYGRKTYKAKKTWKMSCANLRCQESSEESLILDIKSSPSRGTNIWGTKKRKAVVSHCWNLQPALFCKRAGGAGGAGVNITFAVVVNPPDDV